MNTPDPVILTGTIPPDRSLTYLHLPFQVPPGIERIEIAYTYSAAIASDPMLAGGNTLDIGLFDARGIGFSSPGFRGWSGSARSTFFVGRESATPGYMPGSLLAGTWHICLGAYKVAPDGCAYQVTIHMQPAPAAHTVEFPARLALDDAKTRPVSLDGWYTGELHCHTVNSDGDATVAEIVAQAETLGLDFLAITDHNNLTHQVDLARIDTRLLLIPGLEVTTYYGHWNSWGGASWVDFRIQSPADLERAVAFARDQGYLVSCNHPRPYGPDWAFPQVEGYHCVEVWNGPWEVFNTACLAFWESRLRRGQRLSAVGGSDHHFSHREHIARLGHPATRVYLSPGQPPTARAILDAVRAGHCMVSEAPDGPHLTLHADGAIMGDAVPRPTAARLTITIGVERGSGGVLQVIGAGGVLHTVTVDDDSAVYQAAVPVTDTPYVRAQLVDPAAYGQVRALTNPIYLDAPGAGSDG
ncbi:MAG: CehA/McbA family metallohydrolase [bacterium]|nr:CehA/McbA family metallohydrolase [bacterium]